MLYQKEGKGKNQKEEKENIGKEDREERIKKQQKTERKMADATHWERNRLNILYLPYPPKIDQNV